MPTQKKENKPEEKLKPGKFPRFSMGWIYLVFAVGLISLSIFNFRSSNKEEISWLVFKNTMLLSHDVAKLEVINKELVDVYIKPDSLKEEKYEKVKHSIGKHLNPGPHYFFVIGSIEVFEQQLAEAQAGFSEKEKIEVSYIQKADWWSNLLTFIFPIGMLVLLWWFWSRMASRGPGGGSIFDFGKSRAHQFESGKLSKITFKDIAGSEEAKIEVMEVVEFLKYPKRYTKLGAKIPKGILLMGPPGTGKTHMAKAVAGEAEVPFFSLSGSEFVEMFVGVGAARVRDLFNKAKEKAPSIVFIDEIDAIGRVRGAAVSVQSNDERESTLNQLLAEMDGFDPNANVIVIAATNRPDILDSALLRPGRFDRHIFLELPDKKDREAIFKIHMKPLLLDKSIDTEHLALQTPGFSGADIANACNEAALIAAREKKERVEQTDFINAIDRIIGGLEKKSKIISPDEKKIIAYHESGHAIVSWNLKHADPLVKVSIIPRGKALGLSMFLPKERQILTNSEFIDRICVALGGRTAEEIIFNEASSGALDDLERITKEAYSMVALYGLSEKVGTISFYDSTGTYQAFHKPYSEETSKLIDSEVRRIVSEAHDKAKDILLKNQDKLDQLAELLLDKEVVYKDELEKLLGKPEAEEKETKKKEKVKEKVKETV